MIGIEFTGQIPFADVYVHSIIQAPDGRRMSKSLGTGVDPLDLIEGGPRPPVFGSAGRRLPAPTAPTPCAGGCYAMSSAQDVRFSEEQARPGPAADQQAVERGAADPARRRRRMGTRDRRADSHGRRGPLDPFAPGARQGRRSTAGSSSYDFAHAALGLYEFVYGELCDWYLELVKPRLRAGGSRARGHAAVRADADAGDRAPDDPVRDRGDLPLRPRGVGSARGGPARPLRRRPSTSAPRRAWGA